MVSSQRVAAAFEGYPGLPRVISKDWGGGLKGGRGGCATLGKHIEMSANVPAYKQYPSVS